MHGPSADCSPPCASILVSALLDLVLGDGIRAWRRNDLYLHLVSTPSTMATMKQDMGPQDIQDQK